MNVELTSDQLDLVLELVNEAVRDIGPEIRHTDSSSYKDDLKIQQRNLRDIQTRLVECKQSNAASVG